MTRRSFLALLPAAVIPLWLKPKAEPKYKMRWVYVVSDSSEFSADSGIEVPDDITVTDWILGRSRLVEDAIRANPWSTR